MLSDENKEVIREQEMFRKKIRDEPSPLKTISTKERAWEVLNSNFGIWLLSAVLLSGLGSLYTRHQADVDAARKNAEFEQTESRRLNELRERLRLEISFRLSTALSHLNEIDKAQNLSAIEGQRRYIQAALAPLAFPASDLKYLPNDSIAPLFPEFKAYSGIALIAELRRHESDAQKELLKKVITKTSGLISEVYGEKSIGAHTAREVGALLLNKMRDPAWNNGFPFTDCPDQNPFC